MARNFYIEEDEDIPSIYFGLEQPSGFVPLVDPVILARLIKKQYDEREIDGREYFNQIRVQLVSQYSSGQISLTDIFHIEEIIEPVTLKIILGDWMTASFVLSQIVSDYIFTEEFKNQLQIYIGNYISNNY
jgi:hypothetical protein